MSFKDKVVIITGGGSGFGRGIAERFADEGASVIVADVDADNGSRTVATIEARGGRGIFTRCDVRRSNDVADLVASTVQRFGRIDVYVNNAGVAHRFEPMSEVPEEEFDRVMAINVKSIYLSAKFAGPQFIRQRSGNFVNIGSISAKRPRPGIAWYVTSKAAAVAASQAMAIELAPHGVRVNAINPVAGDTPFLNAHGEDSPQLRERFISSIPLGRLAVPADIANAVLFLASDSASLITGAVLDVDGGRGL